MLRTRVTLTIAGDAGAVLASVGKLDRRASTREAQLVIQVRAGGASGRTLGARDEWWLPLIANGDAEQACEKLEEMLERGRLTKPEFDDLAGLVNAFRELTR